MLLHSAHHQSANIPLSQSGGLIYPFNPHALLLWLIPDLWEECNDLFYLNFSVLLLCFFLHDISCFVFVPRLISVGMTPSNSIHVAAKRKIYLIFFHVSSIPLCIYSLNPLICLWVIGLQCGKIIMLVINLFYINI